MKISIPIAILSAAICGCQPLVDQPSQTGRFKVTRDNADTILGAVFVVKDTKTGREYMTFYHGGIIELNPSILESTNSK